VEGWGSLDASIHVNHFSFKIQQQDDDAMHNERSVDMAIHYDPSGTRSHSMYSLDRVVVHYTQLFPIPPHQERTKPLACFVLITI